MDDWSKAMAITDRLYPALDRIAIETDATPDMFAGALFAYAERCMSVYLDAQAFDEMKSGIHKCITNALMNAKRGNK